MGYGVYTGKVSGTVGMCCARHMVVLAGSGVDLQKGEKCVILLHYLDLPFAALTRRRFANVDFAHLSALQPYHALRRIYHGYDINCQYRRNLPKRLHWVKDNVRGMTSIVTTELPDTKHVIPKFHAGGHKRTCRPYFSAYYTPGCAMTDFETQERVWAILNHLGNRTREMTSGHRQDVINDHHSDVNVRQVHKMGTRVSHLYGNSILTFLSTARDLRRKHKDTSKELAKARGELSNLETYLQDGEPEKWEAELRHWVAQLPVLDNHTTMGNPFEPIAEAGTYRSATNVHFADLKQSSHKSKSSSSSHQ